MVVGKKHRTLKTPRPTLHPTIVDLALALSPQTRAVGHNTMLTTLQRRRLAPSPKFPPVAGRCADCSDPLPSRPLGFLKMFCCHKEMARTQKPRGRLTGARQSASRCIVLEQAQRMQEHIFNNSCVSVRPEPKLVRLSQRPATQTSLGGMPAK